VPWHSVSSGSSAYGSVLAAQTYMLTDGLELDDDYPVEEYSSHFKCSKDDDLTKVC
jgi:hypothetical protein